MLAAIVAIGATLRFNGLGWDQPAGAAAPLQMHPDERFISMVNERIAWPSSLAEYFDTARSRLNPYNTPDTPSFVYGTFPLFLAKAVASLPGGVLCAGDGYDRTVVCGRRLTAATDTLTILLVFAIGAVLFGRASGLAGSLLYALAVLPTQLAHFWTVDPYVVFFGAAVLLLAVLFVRHGWDGRRTNGWALTGILAGLAVCLGLGLASKVTAWPLLLGPMLAIAARIGLRDLQRLGLTWRGKRPAIAGHWTTDASYLSITIFAAAMVFRVAQPYAFQGPSFFAFGLDPLALNPQWVADIRREVDFQNGNVDFPPFIQFAGRTPMLWPLQNMVLWGLGPALGIAAWVSTAAAAVVLFRRRDLALLLPLAIVVAVVGFQGLRFVAYMRYFAPAYPALCVFAGWGLLAAWQYGLAHRSDLVARLRVGRARPALRVRIPRQAISWAALGSVGLVFAATTWWALAFQNVYTSEHPRIAASRWVFDNLPPGTRITGEIWDDTIPYPLPGHDPWVYPIVPVAPFETDSSEKLYRMLYGDGNPGQGINGADYIAITSSRVRSAVTRLEREYPATIRFYELLERGDLGFELAAHFEVRPSFLGIRVDTSGAEESFTVYDHPEVWIYRKTDRWDPARAEALLLDAHPDRAVNLLPKQGRTNGLMLTAAEARVQQEGGTFTDVFDGGSFVSRAPWLWWFLWLQASAFATVPFLTWAFRHLPDRGYGLSKVAGFLAVGLATWLLVAWDVFHFSRTLAWAVFGAVLVAGLVAGYARRRALALDLRERWAAVAATEAVFLLVFGAFLALRAANPDLWYHPQGGEKPVDLAYLTAVARSTTLPPYDPWFAGGVMNYYYGGWFFLAVPIRALRILPEVAFNLGIPTYAALTATVVFSTAHNLAGLARPLGQRFLPRHGWERPAVLAGLLATLLVLGIGNLDAAHQTIERLQYLNTWPTAWGTGQSWAWDLPLLGEPLRLTARFLGGTAGVAGGGYQWLVHGMPLPPFDWWRPSRVHIGHFDITEFPYFTFLFGDLHAHLMGLPFFGLTIALGVAVVAAGANGLRSRAWLLAALLGLTAGVVRMVHTWDYPTALVLAGAAIAAAQLLAPGRWQQRWWDGVGQAAVAGAVMTVVFAPYARRFEVYEAGIVLARETTALNQYLAHFGLFVAVLVAFLAVRYREEIRGRAGDPGRNPFLAMVSGRLEFLALLVFTAGLMAFTWRWHLTTVALSVLALAFLANLLWIEWRSNRRDTGRLLATGLFAAAVGIAGGVDVVQASYDIVRMNTVFKFSLQAWQLYGVASAFGAWYVLRALWRADGWRVEPRHRRSAWAMAAAAGFGALVLGSFIYVTSGTPARQAARFEGSPKWTLDGLAYLDYGFFVEDHGTPEGDDDRLIRLADDRPLIEWLRGNVGGSPVIAEAVGPLYHWTSRISVNTGLPTVVGWDWHQVAYRTAYDYLVQRRRIETRLFFTTPDPLFAQAYIERYNVSYVVLGPVEYVFGTEEGLAKFRSMPGLRQVFASGPYAIYEVISR
jgi:YYY domain-containing protein